MSHDIDKVTHLIVRLIGLTNSKKIKWRRQRPDLNRMPSDRRYRNFVYVAEIGEDIFRLSQYEYQSFFEDETYWTSDIDLEMIDESGSALWICPSNPAIHDLFQIVVNTTADIDSVMARLDSFAKAS